MNVEEKQEKKVYEPELLPPNDSDSRQSPKSRTSWDQWRKTFGPIMVGFLIDMLDFSTPAFFGIQNGLIVGLVATYAICSMYNLPQKNRLLWAMTAGIYCALPGTSRIPLGTIAGTLLRFKKF